MNTPISRAKLIERMKALHAGLEDIAERYSEGISFGWEEPEAFGAGHFVFAPLESHLYRFTIEEQFADIDWMDTVPIPRSWTWTSELGSPHGVGESQWMAISGGEVASADHEELLQEADAWAERITILLARAEAVTPDPTAIEQQPAPGMGRTWLV